MIGVLDLCAGIGGFSLGLERTGGFVTRAFCEIEPFPRAVLRKHWPEVPIYKDVHDLTRERLENDAVGSIQCIAAGYPCQPFSHAGKRRGEADDRHIWPEIIRLIREISPRFVLLENVIGHVSMGLDQVLSDLENRGYAVEPFIIPACAVDAPHRRDRVWIFSYRDDGSQNANKKIRSGRNAPIVGGATVPESERERRDPEGARNRRNEKSEGSQNGEIPPRYRRPLADSPFARGSARVARSERGGYEGSTREPDDESNVIGGAQAGGGVARWATEPDIRRVAHGIPSRVDRIKSLGNAVVPELVEVFAWAILEMIDEEIAGFPWGPLEEGTE